MLLGQWDDIFKMSSREAEMWINPAFYIVLGLVFVFPYWLFLIFAWTVTADQQMNKARTQHTVYAQYYI